MKSGMLSTLVLVVGMTLATFAQTAGPTKDVCCFGYSDTEGEITTFSTPMSTNNCKAGAKDPASRNICGSADNLDECAYMKTETVCTRCGFHWLKDLGKCSKKSLEELVPKKEETPKVDKKK